MRSEGMVEEHRGRGARTVGSKGRRKNTPHNIVSRCQRQGGEQYLTVRATSWAKGKNPILPKICWGQGTNMSRHPGQAETITTAVQKGMNPWQEACDV